MKLFKGSNMVTSICWNVPKMCVEAENNERFFFSEKLNFMTLKFATLTFNEKYYFY